MLSRARIDAARRASTCPASDNGEFRSSTSRSRSSVRGRERAGCAAAGGRVLQVFVAQGVVARQVRPALRKGKQGRPLEAAGRNPTTVP